MTFCNKLWRGGFDQVCDITSSKIQTNGTLILKDLRFTLEWDGPSIVYNTTLYPWQLWRRICSRRIMAPMLTGNMKWGHYCFVMTTVSSQPINSTNTVWWDLALNYWLWIISQTKNTFSQKKHFHSCSIFLFLLPHNLTVNNYVHVNCRCLLIFWEESDEIELIYES